MRALSWTPSMGESSKWRPVTTSWYGRCMTSLWSQVRKNTSTAVEPNCESKELAIINSCVFCLVPVHKQCSSATTCRRSLQITANSDVVTFHSDFSVQLMGHTYTPEQAEKASQSRDFRYALIQAVDRLYRPSRSTERPNRE